MKKLNSMKMRDVMMHTIEYRFKKGKSFIVQQNQVVSVCKTAIEMNQTARLIVELKAKAFGIKSVGYKTPNNLWVTKVIDSMVVSKSFHYNDSNFDDNDIKLK